MRNRKFVKPLLIVVAMILVCIMSVFATLAYLTSTDKVTNTFTVGKVAITLDEAKVDEYGVPVEGAGRVEGNEYKLVPNHTYTKDPTVTVAADSEESFVRMLVKITDYEDVKAAFNVAEGEQFLPQYFVSDWDPAVWVTTNEIIVDDNAAYYEFRYHTTVSTAESDAKELPVLFKSFKIPEGIENTALASLEEMEIIVIAEAVQKDGFVDAEAAFAATFGVSKDIVDDFNA